RAGRRRVQIRWILTSVALILSIFAYLFVAGLLGPNRNLFAQLFRQFVPASYTLFSGSEGGFYIKMGEFLQLETREGEEGIVVSNQPSSGAINNARKVMVTKRSFGFVQEDTLQARDFERNHIRYVTPLYLERLHILYDQDAYEKFRDEWLLNPENRIGDYGNPPEKPSLARETHPCVKDFFHSAHVSTGPAGSGTQLYSRYLLDYCGLKPKVTLNRGFSDALSSLGKGGSEKVDVVFTIAGAPLFKVVLKMLPTSGKFQLMSIDSAIAPELNRNYDLRLRSTTFSGRYEEGDRVSTIATYCFLICSPDVPDSDILEFLRVLDESGNAIRGSLQLTAEQEFQLDEFDFYGAFNQKYEGFAVELAWNLVIFVLVIALVFTLTLVVCSRLISEIRRIQNLRKVTAISHDYLPDNANLDRDPARLPKPVIYDDQWPILSRLIQGMSELVSVGIRIRNHYDSGQLRMTDYEHLRSSIHSLRDVFQQNLAQRLNEFIDSGNPIPEKQLRHYFTAGYIEREAYILLLDNLKQKKIEEEVEEKKEGTAKTEIFISYRQMDDLNIVSRLYDRLAEKFGGSNVFLDKNTIPPGAKFPARLRKQIVKSDAVLAIVGKNWIREEKPGSIDWVMVELQTALDHEIPIVPIVLDGATFPLEKLPEKLHDISEINTTKLREDPDDFNSDCSKIIECVETLVD
ncbi:MAG: TIR domain-containing protein, partial [Verrucomicrobiota bacterium]